MLVFLDFGFPEPETRCFDFVFLLLCLCAFVCLLCSLWCSVFWFACHWFLRLTLSCTDHRPVRDNNNVEFSAPCQIGNKCVENKMIYSWSEIYSNHICPGLTLDQWETIIILKNTTIAQARNTERTNKTQEAPADHRKQHKHINLKIGPGPQKKHNPEKRELEKDQLLVCLLYKMTTFNRLVWSLLKIIKIELPFSSL